MSRVLLVSTDVVGPNMAGPAIRAVELARALATRHRTVLAVPNESSVDAGVTMTRYAHESLGSLAAGFDVVVVGGLTLALSPSLAATDVPIVMDIYPFTLENLQLLAGRPIDERRADHDGLLNAVWTELGRGDFFLVASEKQRDLWLGFLHAVGRLNPHTYDDDRTARRLIDVVPFGMPAEPPAPRSHGLKGTWPGIGRDDFVVYWGGGLYDWLDPVTAVRAAGLAAQRDPRVRLFFPATKHPNPTVRPMAALEETLRVASSLGLTGRVVFFNDWVPYDRRADFLMDADAGLSLHLAHVETAFSFRTRILDYIWAGLPMVASAGDTLASLVTAHDLGYVVEVGDVEGVAEAFVRLAAEGDPRPRYRERLAALAGELSWQRCAAALVAYCDSPRRAPDLASGYRYTPQDAGGAREHSPGRVGKALASLRAGGPPRLLADVGRWLERRARRAR